MALFIKTNWISASGYVRIMTDKISGTPVVYETSISKIMGVAHYAKII